MSLSLEPLKPYPPRVRPPVLYILLAVLLLVLPKPLLLIHSQKPSLRPCGHIVLVSAARHGSTWFVDCAEGCTAENGSFGDLNKQTELWNKGQEGPVRDIEPRLAAEYAKNNRSVKVFPPALVAGRGPLTQFFESVRDLDLPVFVLKRKIEDSYGSLQAAKSSNIWNASSGVRTEARTIVKDRKFENYVARIENFFDDVLNLMKQVGVRWDLVKYEDITDEAIIVGERNRCYIKNCNFRR